MATQYIPTNTSKRLGADLRQTIHMLKEVRSDLREIVLVMEAMVYGEDYSQIEVEFGLPTGTGQTAYNLVAGACSATEDAPINQAIVRLG